MPDRHLESGNIHPSFMLTFFFVPILESFEIISYQMRFLIYLKMRGILQVGAKI